MQPIGQLRIVHARVPAEPRQSGAVLQPYVDVELGLRLLPLLRQLGIVELPVRELLRRPGEDVVEHGFAGLDAGGREQRQRSQPGGAADGDLRRDPAAEAVSHEMNIAQVQRLHQVEVEERHVADAHHPVRNRPASEARMLRRQHAESAAEAVEQRIPCRARNAVQEQHGRPGAGLAVAELGARDVDH